MIEFDIHYSIVNKYDNPVRKANFQLLVTPYRIHELTLLDHNIFCKPNVKEHLSTNSFGFQTINFFINQPFTEFHFEYIAKIQRAKVNPYNFISFPVEVEARMMGEIDFYIEHHLFLTETPLTSLPGAFKDQLPVFAPNMQVFEYVQGLNEFVYEFMGYVPDSTNTDTTVAEVLELKKGVCQDYTHLFISICRANKIPARYVSGYLNQGIGFQGASQLHAWVETFLPGLGWMGFDPTNNLLVDENYIKIAHGTDYNDCSPIKGVLENKGLQKSNHSVSVINQ